MRRTQHIVVGAGLAGLVSAHFLRSQSVLVLDPSPGGYKIGESLIPEVFRHPELEALLPKVMALPSYVRKWGTTFVGPDSVVAFPLGESEAARACHVFRPELEAMLAETWGIEVERAAVTGIDLEARVVHTTIGDIAFSGLLIDCSGPAMVVASLLGEVSDVHPVHARWRYFDVTGDNPGAFAEGLEARDLKLAHFDARQGEVVPMSPEADWSAAETTILSRAQNGVWSWQIPLYGGTVVSVGVVSRHGPVTEELYDEVVETQTTKCFAIRPRPLGDQPLDRVHVRSGFARKAKRAAGEQFVLMSDAFAFSDPVYSVGAGVAVNQAVRLATQLLDGGWNAEVAAGFSEDAERMYERATEAFSLWYADETKHWSQADTQVQDTMLNGGLFAESLVREYGIRLNDADLASHADPFQRIAGAAPLDQALATAFQAMGAPWEIHNPVTCAGGVRLAVQHRQYGELLVLLHHTEGAARGVVSNGPLSVSYMSPDTPWPREELTGICGAVLSGAAAQSDRWHELLMECR